MFEVHTEQIECFSGRYYVIYVIHKEKNYLDTFHELWQKHDYLPYLEYYEPFLLRKIGHKRIMMPFLARLEMIVPDKVLSTLLTR